MAKCYANHLIESIILSNGEPIMRSSGGTLLLKEESTLKNFKVEKYVFEGALYFGLSPVDVLRLCFSYRSESIGGVFYDFRQIALQRLAYLIKLLKTYSFGYIVIQIVDRVGSDPRCLGEFRLRYPKFAHLAG